MTTYLKPLVPWNAHAHVHRGRIIMVRGTHRECQREVCREIEARWQATLRQPVILEKPWIK